MPKLVAPSVWLSETSADLGYQAVQPLLEDAEARRQQATTPQPVQPSFASLVPDLSALLGGPGQSTQPSEPSSTAPAASGGWLSGLPSLTDLLGGVSQSQQTPQAPTGTPQPFPTTGETIVPGPDQSPQGTPVRSAGEMAPEIAAARAATPAAQKGPIDNSSRQAFARTAYPYALEAAGGDPELAKRLLASAISENGTVGSGGEIGVGFNFGGIKHDPEAVGSGQYGTWESEGGQRVNQTAGFAHYAGPQEGFNAIPRFLQRNFPRQWERYQQTRDAAQLYRDINAGGYATDPNWHAAIESITANQVAPAVASLPSQPPAAVAPSSRQPAELAGAPARVTTFQTPNLGGPRRATRGIVVHSTRGQGKTPEDEYQKTLEWFANPRSEVSAHAVIAADGTIATVGNWDAQTWHAGENNADRIGIELVQSAADNDRGVPFTDAQYRSLAWLTGQLSQRYGFAIDRNALVGHEELEQGQRGGKTDPGKSFDWGRYQQESRAYASQPVAAAAGGDVMRQPLNPGETPGVPSREPAGGFPSPSVGSSPLDDARSASYADQPVMARNSLDPSAEAQADTYTPPQPVVPQGMMSPDPTDIRELTTPNVQITQGGPPNGPSLPVYSEEIPGPDLSPQGTPITAPRMAPSWTYDESPSQGLPAPSPLTDAGSPASPARWQQAEAEALERERREIEAEEERLRQQRARWVQDAQNAGIYVPGETAPVTPGYGVPLGPPLPATTPEDYAAQQGLTADPTAAARANVPGYQAAPVQNPIAPPRPVQRQAPAEEEAASILAAPPDPGYAPTPERITVPSILPGSAGRMLSEDVQRAYTGARSPSPLAPVRGQISPVSVLLAVSELPFDLYTEARRKLISDAEARRLTGTDPLAPFRALGVQGLPSVEEINPEGRPAGDVIGGLLAAGLLPDPGDPFVQQAFRAAGAGLRLGARGAGAASRAVGRTVGRVADDLATPAVADDGVQMLGSGVVPDSGVGQGAARGGQVGETALVPVGRGTSVRGDVIPPSADPQSRAWALHRQVQDWERMLNDVSVSAPDRRDLVVRMNTAKNELGELLEDLDSQIDEARDAVREADRAWADGSARGRGLSYEEVVGEPQAELERLQAQRAQWPPTPGHRPDPSFAEPSPPAPQMLGSGTQGGSGVVPSSGSGLFTQIHTAAQGGAMGAISEDLQAAQEGREADPQERMRRLLTGAALGVGVGRAARRGGGLRAGRQLGSGVVVSPDEAMIRGLTRPGVIPPEMADQLDIPVRLPDDPRFGRAVSAIGGEIDPERGVTLPWARAQAPDAAGRPATRGGVFAEAIPPDRPSAYATQGDNPNNVGGTQVLRGQTRFRSPLVLEDAPGSAQGFDEGMRLLGRVDSEEVLRLQDELARLDALKEDIDIRMTQAQLDRAPTDALQRQYDDVSNRAADTWGRLNELRQGMPTADEIGSAIQAARRTGPEGSPARAAALKEVVQRFGGDPDLIEPLLAVRGADASESAWAIKENILAAHARRAGYDGVFAMGGDLADGDAIAKHPLVVTAAQNAQKLGDEWSAASEEVQRLSQAGRQYTGGTGPDRWAMTPEMTAALARQQRAADAYEQAVDQVAKAEAQAERELSGSRISEYMDVRASTNPRRPPHPRVAALQAEADANAARAEEIANRLRETAQGQPRQPGESLQQYVARQSPEWRAEWAEGQRLASADARIYRHIEELETSGEAPPGPPTAEVRPDVPRGPGANFAGVPFDPAGAAAGAGAGAMSGEEGEEPDPWRTGLGMVIGGILGRKGLNAAEREAWARAIRASAARGGQASDELVEQAERYAQRQMPGFEAIDPLTDARSTLPAPAPRAITDEPNVPLSVEQAIANRGARQPAMPGMEPPPARPLGEVADALGVTGAQAPTPSVRGQGGQTYLPTMQPGVVARIRQAIAPWGNRLSIFRYGNMLSDTAGHAFNATSNLVLQAADVAVTPIAATIDVGRSVATGRPRQVFFREVPARLAGMRSGAKAGLQNAVEIMRTGLRPEDATKLDAEPRGFGTNIPGLAPEGSRRAVAVNAAFEWPLRALAAADAVFRGSATGGHLAAEAYAAARKANGGKPPTSAQFAAMMKDPQILALADEMAARSVLQEDRTLTRWWRDSMQKAPLGVRAIVGVEMPFVRTPYNVMAQGVGLTPAGLLGAVNDMARGKPARGIEHTIGRVALGTAVMGWAATDYANGTLTGPYPSDPAEASTLPPGWKPWSRKIEAPNGETYYVPLVLLGPFAVPAVAAILAGESIKQGKDALSPEWAGAVALGVGRYAEQNTFFEGFGAISKVFDERSGDANIERHLESIVSQFSPQVIGGGALGREIQRIAGMPARDPEGMLEALLATHPATAEAVRPRQDVLGREESLGVSGPAGMVVRAGVENDAAVIAAFRSAHQSLPRTAPKQLTDPGTNQSFRLTADQRAAWERAFGVAVQTRWASAGYPFHARPLANVAREAREDARRAVLGR